MVSPAVEPSVPRGGTDAETQRRAVVASSLTWPKSISRCPIAG